MPADWADASDERDGLVGGGRKQEKAAAPTWFYVGVLVLGAIGLILIATGGSSGDESAPAVERGPVGGGIYAAGIGSDMTAPPPPMVPDPASIAGAVAATPPALPPCCVAEAACRGVCGWGLDCCRSAAECSGMCAWPEIFPPPTPAPAAAGACVDAVARPPPLGFSAQASSGPTDGWLMVVGGGGLPRSSADRFKTLAQQARGGAGGPSATIVYIPTNDGLDYSTPESCADAVAALEASTGWHGMVVLLHTTDPRQADRPGFYAPIDAAGGVFFGGGRQWRMADAYGGTATEAALHRVLARDGILGGSSAGASIQGDFMVRGDTASNAAVIGDHTVGFGFVHNVGFDQHTLRRNRQNDMIEAVAANPEILGFSMDEQTSVLIRGDELEVLGSVARGVYSYVAVTDGTLWSDTNYCGNYALTSGVGRPLLANSQKFFLLHTGDRYNLKTRGNYTPHPPPQLQFNRSNRFSFFFFFRQVACVAEVLPSVTPLHAVCDIVPTTQTVPGSGLSAGKMYLLRPHIDHKSINFPLFLDLFCDLLCIFLG